MYRNATALTSGCITSFSVPARSASPNGRGREIRTSVCCSPSVCSVCAGAILLAEAGLLAGRSAMTIVIQFTVPDGWPIHLTWAAMALGVIAGGAGRLSLDHWLVTPVASANEQPTPRPEPDLLRQSRKSPFQRRLYRPVARCWVRGRDMLPASSFRIGPKEAPIVAIRAESIFNCTLMQHQASTPQYFFPLVNTESSS
ncbi:hypothetical protein FB008_1453 [Sinorhizobium medicae]|nr:hypothetical protein FB008_1453 [Sinorhizobium medicae]